ncbi:hypothetical protein ABIE09_002320 [Lysobacter enzymogenes]|uniref:hypothetical protein n=1 Tax=Lysobacter enzymogenes TaxID=69 RepID=UPI003398A5F4
MRNEFAAITCALLWGSTFAAHGAARAQVDYVWRAETVPCEAGNGVVVESALLTALVPTLLERGFSMLASGVRSAIKNAAQDKSETFSLSNATYLASVSTQNGPGKAVVEPRGCIAIARGRPIADGDAAAAPAFLAQASSQQRPTIAKDLGALKLADVDFYAHIAFESSKDAVATRARLRHLYYPVRLYSGRASAARALSIAATVALPGQKEALYAATLTVKNPVPAPVLNDSVARAESEIGWFPTPKVELSDQQKKKTGPAVPVNLAVVVVETANGSEFFKRLDRYFDEDTWSAVTAAAKTAVLPAARDAAEDKARSGYENAIVAYFEAMSGWESACASLTAEDTPETRAGAVKAYFAANSAYRAMQEAKVSGVEIPLGQAPTKPEACAR